jgi:hypothetical protein
MRALDEWMARGLDDGMPDRSDPFKDWTWADFLVISIALVVVVGGLWEMFR